MVGIWGEVLRGQFMCVWNATTSCATSAANFAKDLAQTHVLPMELQAKATYDLHGKAVANM